VAIEDSKKCPPAMDRNSRVFIAGHRGMVGSAIYRCLQRRGYRSVITRSHDELDLTDQQAVRSFLSRQPLDHIVLAAAKVGGIHANHSYPAEFVYQNLAIEANVIHEAHQAGVQRLLFLGSSCIYPREALQPMKEEYLLSGPLEPTNKPYAIAKIAGIAICEAYNRQYGRKYRCVMPTNLYGPNDNYDLENSHALPAMIRKFHLAKLAAEGDWSGIEADADRYGSIPEEIMEGLKGRARDDSTQKNCIDPVVKLWGSGSPKREFLHVDDLASACVHLMEMPDVAYASALSGENDRPSAPANGGDGHLPVSHINIGTGEDHTIAELAEIVKNVVNFHGQVVWDGTKPDGTPRKLLDVTRLKGLGWEPTIPLAEGVRSTYEDYCGYGGYDR